jgi:hypothetical protein
MPPDPNSDGHKQLKQGASGPRFSYPTLGFDAATADRIADLYVRLAEAGDKGHGWAYPCESCHDNGGAAGIAASGR